MFDLLSKTEIWKHFIENVTMFKYIILFYLVSLNFYILNGPSWVTTIEIEKCVVLSVCTLEHAICE